MQHHESTEKYEHIEHRMLTRDRYRFRMKDKNQTERKKFNDYTDQNELQTSFTNSEQTMPEQMRNTINND